jgi:hypothetical protein
MDESRIRAPEMGEERGPMRMMDELREMSKSTGFRLVFITAAGDDWDELQDAILEGKNGGQCSLRPRTRAFRDTVLLPGNSYSR